MHRRLAWLASALVVAVAIGACNQASEPTMHVEPGQVQSTTRPDGGLSMAGTMGRVDLSCGRLTIWAGDAAPSGPGPDPSPGQPGDCVP